MGITKKKLSKVNFAAIDTDAYIYTLLDLDLKLYPKCGRRRRLGLWSPSPPNPLHTHTIFKGYRFHVRRGK